MEKQNEYDPEFVAHLLTVCDHINIKLADILLQKDTEIQTALKRDNGLIAESILKGQTYMMYARQAVDHVFNHTDHNVREILRQHMPSGVYEAKDMSNALGIQIVDTLIDTKSYCIQNR